MKIPCCRRYAKHVGSESKVVTLAGLTIGTGGVVDTTSDDLVLNSAALSTITGYRGSQLISSAAAADTTHLTTLAIIQNNQSGAPIFSAAVPFDGVIPAASAVIIKYTYFGDANLDGKVDGSDYALIDNGYNRHLTGWLNGDFNYDGIVDGSDYTLIDNAFNNQTQIFVAAATGQIAIPEPGVTGLVFLLGLGVRRSRKLRWPLPF